MALRVAALILRRGCFAGTEAGVAGEPDRMARSSAICSSIRRFCASKPSIAASIISFVSLEGIHSHSDMEMIRRLLGDWAS